MPASPPPAAPAPGKLAEFEVIRRLGAGGMAEVFLAKKRGAEGTFKILVLKRILPTYGTSRRFRAMFVEEAQVATRLNHPNVVQVYEFYDGGDEGQILAMEHVEGCDLGRLIACSKAHATRLDPWLVAWIISEAAKGLHYAHEKKDEAGQRLEIVHRDVSPQNILLSYEGAVKIADFGIASAKLFVEEAGVIKGKFGYMSPEQARGESVDRRGDLYALGVIFWELLTGRLLHGGLGGEALLDIVRSGIVETPSTYVADLPEEIESMVMRLLEPKREDRFASGRDLVLAIGKATLQKQKLVDAATLEAVIAELVPRELVIAEYEHEESPRSRPPDALTQAAGPRARSVHEGIARTSLAVPVRSVHKEDVSSGDLGAAPETTDGPREVRHVAVVSLRLHGFDFQSPATLPAARRALAQVRSTLDDVAWKRGVRWIWNSDTEARAIAGLTAIQGRSAQDATMLALDAHETIAEISDELGLEVRGALGIVRGIASGTRDAEGHLVAFDLEPPGMELGDVLVGATPAGQMWVAGGIYRLVRRDYKWAEATTIAVHDGEGANGIPPKMRVYALERALSREERLEAASELAGDLVGREREREELRLAFRSACTGAFGTGELVTRAITGEMGIGKSVLVAGFLSELGPNHRVVHVECSPVRLEVPFSASGELVRSAIGASGEEPFDEVVQLIAKAGGGAAQGDVTSQMVARLAELVTNRRLTGDEQDASTYKRLVISGIRNLIAAIALEQPLVLVIEGLQWADRPTLDVLTEIIRTRDPLPVLVLLVTRIDERVGSALRDVKRIELHGLSADEQVRLVETRLGVREGVAEVCSDILPRVGGNPFFLLEMVDALLERGVIEMREVGEDEDGPRHALVRVSQAAGDARALPSTLEQLLGDRIRELPKEESQVVEWLAIAGGPLSVSDLMKLSGAVNDEAIVRLCARGICDRKGDAVDCRHPLTRDVAYLSLQASKRADLHRRLGEHLALTPMARGLSAAIVARHLVRGDTPLRAAHYYMEAASAARATYQNALAIRYNQRALLALDESDPRAFTVHDALESAYRMIGKRRSRVRHLEALRRVARKLGTPRAVCTALLREARFELDEGHLARGVLVAGRAAEIAHVSKNAALEIESEGLVGEIMGELGDVQGALAACDRALATSDPSLHPQVPLRSYADVLRARGVMLRRVGRVREAVDSYVDAIAIFRKVGARRLEARAMNALAYAMFVQGRYEDAISLALEAIQIDLAIGGRFQIAKTLTNIGHAYFRLGDVARGLAYLKRARDAHERYGDQDGRADTLLVSAVMYLELGEPATAEPFLSDAGALNLAIDNAYDRTHECLVRAIYARAVGKPTAAIAHAMEARHSAERQALVAFHFYALALEAVARVDAGELHSGTLLATMASGGVDNLQGCEFGLEIRLLAADALRRAGSPQAGEAEGRAIDYAIALLNTIRDERFRALFVKRPTVAKLLGPGFVASRNEGKGTSSSPATLAGDEMTPFSLGNMEGGTRTVPLSPSAIDVPLALEFPLPEESARGFSPGLVGVGERNVGVIETAPPEVLPRS